MAPRPATISTPTTSQQPSSYGVLMRKMVLIFLLIAATALGLAILFRTYQIYSKVLLIAFTNILLGLIAGFSVRLIIRTRRGLLRINSAITALVVGLALLGLMTGWQIGIGPLKFGRSSVDWFGLGQLLAGIGVTLLALQAWQRPRQAFRPSPKLRPIGESPKSKKQPSKQPRHRMASRVSRRALKQTVRPAPTARTERPAQPKRKHIYHRKPKLLLSADEEHRCPYCLELVKMNDQRGIVECKVCHTLHHADCWAVTGTCQVPHYNT